MVACPPHFFLEKTFFLNLDIEYWMTKKLHPPQFWRSMYKNWSEIKEKEVYAPPCIISLLWNKLFIMQLNKFEREICMFRNIKHCLKLKCWLKKILIINLKNYYSLKKKTNTIETQAMYLDRLQLNKFHAFIF